MARRRRAERRKITPDPKYNNEELAQFINKMMLNGKKTVAQRIVYEALELASDEVRRPELEVFEQAIRNTTPMVEVKSRRVGGATYQVPTEVRPERRLALAMRWIITAARGRRGATDGAAPIRRACRGGARTGDGSQAARGPLPHGGGEPRVRALPLVARIWATAPRAGFRNIPDGDFGLPSERLDLS